MPNLNCPSCGLAVYSAAKHSTVDLCPRCGMRLGARGPAAGHSGQPAEEPPSIRIGDDKLECSTYGGPPEHRIVVHGDLHYPLAERLGLAAEGIDVRADEMLIVDLRRLTDLDSSGLAQLLGIYLRSRREGFSLVVVRPPREMQRIFELTQVSERLTMVDDPQSAAAALGGGPEPA